MPDKLPLDDDDLDDLRPDAERAPPDAPVAGTGAMVDAAFVAFRSNTPEARVEKYLRLATRLGLTVHGFEVRGHGIRILTQPLGAAPEQAEDAVDRWLRENA